MNQQRKLDVTSAALVTAATSGIGAAIAKRLSREGFHVVVHTRDAEMGAALAESLTAQGGSASVVVKDLFEVGAAEDLAQVASTTGYPLELVVNNAGGVAGETSFQRHQPPQLTKGYEINLEFPFALSVLAAQQMEVGSIVNISSINAYSVMAAARIPLYSAAKAGLTHLTQMLACKLAPNVRVNVVSPGRTITDGIRGTMTESLGDANPDWEAAVVSDALIERWVQPEEIADAVWFLHDNKACTGVDLRVDGGIGLRAILTNT